MIFFLLLVVVDVGDAVSFADGVDVMICHLRWVTRVRLAFFIGGSLHSWCISISYW